MSASQKPSIFQIGKVYADGESVVISGWGLGLCALGCPCHRSPATGQLSIAEDSEAGTLGLSSHAAGGCDCCEPWTSTELAAVLGDLKAVRTLTTVQSADD